MNDKDYALLERVKKYDFFAETAKDFYEKMNIESVLVQGNHWDPPPMITVILPTYKRPKLLEQALQSALWQEGFDDYQILIADNEGVDITCETETSQLVAKYQDERIIYYRHNTQAFYKMDTAVNLARSEWICFLHDDDLLVKNHLAVMSKIVLENPQISYLSCPHKLFNNYIDKTTFFSITQAVHGKYDLFHYPPQYSCIGNVPGWLGALIKREKYIDIGGMPALATGIGDFIMQGKFRDRWGTYTCRMNDGLYCYRQWSGQDTALGTSFWTRNYCVEYNYYIYMVNRYHKKWNVFWKGLGEYIIINKCKEKNNGFYELDISIEEIKETCNMEINVEKEDWKYWCYKKFLLLYTFYIEKLCNLHRVRGRF